ncbi:succinate dehydrogenase assembly factor 2, mitochondrial [Gastrolobium bilobum]|uniref:succinate dehydrogenase assembly factor 2, mitochondrial n=1 Tax=Gastrolobium bilobum TaxID=150636 RepID=UPI002AB2DE53|nr:succinate dehydrogenase assembly factor 2, mitochondrial [Gastrolobium bilobum]
MATLRKAVINIHRLINSNKGTISASPNPLLTLRPLLGYSRITPFTSHTQSLEIDLSNEESKRRLFNRLLYRSKQRGFLELDLVLGKWVEDNIHSLDENRIKALIHVLDLENPDLWKWISGQEQPPESISINPVFAAVRERVMKNLDSHSAPEARATPGQPWVRGWDDIKKGQDGPVSGNQ